MADFELNRLFLLLASKKGLLTVQWTPKYPIAHVQENPSAESSALQVPPFWHGSMSQFEDYNEEKRTTMRKKKY